MGNLIVAVIGPSGYSNSLGKKGTSTDITLYNLKRGEDTVTLIEPERYPERLAPLFYSTSMAKKAIVVVEELNSTLGESLVMLQCCGIDRGYFILRNFIQPEKIRPLISDTILENYEFISDDPATLRDKLLDEVSRQNIPELETGTIPIDHSFNVKGVGTVILGVVNSGSVRKYDVMKVLPGIKTATVRSIQKHDDEYDVAFEGDRVGIALKNTTVKDLERGTVLTNEQTIKSSKNLSVNVSLVKYWRSEIKEGMVLHLGHWMQFLNTKAESVQKRENGDLIVNLSSEKELIYKSGDKAVLMYLEGGKLRIVGTAQLN